MKKSLITSSLTALAALCLCVTAQAQGPVVVSDKDDYAPGETAHFSAAGFQPNELLDFSVAVQDDQGLWVPDVAWADIPADGSGGADVMYVVPQTWANKTLQLTVTGLSSSLMAQTTFTDASPNQVSFTASGSGGPPAFPSGVAINVTGTFINNGNNSQTIQSVVGTPAFTTPGSSTNVNCDADHVNDMQFTFSPISIPVTGGHYQLNSFSVSGNNAGTLQNVNVSTGYGEYNSGPSETGSNHPVITANYTFVMETTNQPPHIACTGNDANLGAVVGCLGTGTGFGQTFPVSYTQSGTNPVTVTATFTLPDSSTVPVTVATISDPDMGDIVTVTLTGGTNPVTISGPGSGTAPFTVHIEASDSHGLPADNNPQDCGGDANAQIVYNFGGFLPPLNGQINTKVKRGSGVPVKFQLFDCSMNPITTGNHTISVAHLIPMAPMGDPTVDDAGISGDNGTNFRYDPTGMLWIFNLKTNTSYVVGDSYQITAHLDDGTDHNVTISIK